MREIESNIRLSDGNRTPILIKLTVVLCGLLMPHFAGADTSEGAYPLFEADQPLMIELIGPWREISKDRNPDPEWRDATLRLTDAQTRQTAENDLAIRVQPRGKSRRRPEVCDFPPLWLNFKRSELAGTVFANQNKLKLVTHCGRLGTRATSYADRLHSEYLLYRIFNQFTPLSFRVRAVSVTYIDENDKSAKRYSHPAFIIEHKRTLAERNSAVLSKKNAISLKELDADYSATAALFAYFAGNTDYSFRSSPDKEGCCHNSVPLSIGSDQQAGDQKGGGKVFSVPYDFDSTGFVDPPYAVTADGLGLSRVTTRLHRGYCRHSPSLPQAIEQFQKAKQQTLGLIEDYAPLSNKQRKILLRYTNKFYEVIDNPKKTERLLAKRCR